MTAISLPGNLDPFLRDGFERHRRELTGSFYRMLGSPSEANDAVQDTWAIQVIEVAGGRIVGHHNFIGPPGTVGRAVVNRRAPSPRTQQRGRTAPDAHPRGTTSRA